MTCMLAEKTVAKRCVDAVSSRLPPRYLSFLDVQALMDGAKRYSDGDVAGAANSWRPLLKIDWAIDILIDVFAPALDKVGESELASKIDRARIEKGGRYGGADLAFVREALRAEHRGDKSKAKELAEKVVDAWSPTTDVPPAVADMKKLLSRL